MQIYKFETRTNVNIVSITRSSHSSGSPLTYTTNLPASAEAAFQSPDNPVDCGGSMQYCIISP